MSDLDLFSKLEIYEVNGDSVSKQTYDAIVKLQSKLDCAVKALEFYGDLKNWGWQNQTMLTFMKNPDDYDIRHGFTSKHCGKRARLALEEIKK